VRKVPVSPVRWILGGLALFAASAAPSLAPSATATVAPPIPETVVQLQPKVVKVYGAGGPRGLEAYQSGFLISAEGHVLTAWSYVLDSDSVTVTLHDGRKFEARLLGADPRLEVAVLKIEATGLPYFDLGRAVDAQAGTRVLALSNLFGVAMGNEPVSVQRGTISVKTRLEARRGAYEIPYDGPVYVLDAVTNNPGAAGGALVTRRGELVAMLGKELRNALNGTWLNYAVPIDQVRTTVEQIRSGKFVVRKSEEAAKKPARPLTLAMLGIAMVPDVVERTPPYVDAVAPGSPAAKAGLQPDDLVVLVGDRFIPSCKALSAELQYIDFEDPLRLTVLRGQQMLQFVLQASQMNGRKRSGQDTAK